MKMLYSIAPLLFALPLCAQEPVPLAQGNAPGEPHHHLKIENEYVRVYYVEVPAHESTQLHQHDHDYLFVSLGPADVVNAVRDKPEVHLVLKDGETHFTRGGFAHVARNLADTPFRNATIELLKPQGEAHNLCSQFVVSSPIGPCNKHGDIEPQFDTEGVSVDLLRFSPKTAVVVDTPKVPLLIVSLQNSGVKIVENGGPARSLSVGEAAWFAAGSHVEFSNDPGEVASFLKILFTDKDALTKP